MCPGQRGEKKRRRKELAVPMETSHILDGVMLNFMHFGDRPLL